MVAKGVRPRRCEASSSRAKKVIRFGSAGIAGAVTGDRQCHRPRRLVQADDGDVEELGAAGVDLLVGADWLPVAQVVEYVLLAAELVDHASDNEGQQTERDGDEQQRWRQDEPVPPPTLSGMVRQRAGAGGSAPPTSASRLSTH